MKRFFKCLLLLNIITLLILPRSAFSFLCLILQPQVLADPTSIDFGSTNLDTPKKVSMTVTYTSGRIYIDGVCSCNCSNPGSSSVTITSSSPATFSVNPSSFTLAEGESRIVEVTFSPTTASGEGNYTGSLEIDPSASGAGTITVSLVGVGYKPKPNINVTPTSFEFGSQPVNSEAGQTLTISNEGDAALDGSLSLSAPFSASPTSFSIAAGASKSFTIKFKPTSRGPVSGNLTVASNDPDSPSLLLGLSGTGVAPYLSVNPASLDFGTIPVGETITKTLTIREDSSEDIDYSTDLVLSSLTLSGAGFNFSNPGTLTISKGSSQTIGISFTPSSAGTYSGTLTLTSNDPWNSPKTVGLSATAVAPSIDPSTLSLSFGNVRLGTTATQTFSIQNKGSSTLSISSIASSSPRVSVAPTTATISAGASQSFTATYTPSSSSFNDIFFTLSGTLTIASNDPVLPNLVISTTASNRSPYLDEIKLLEFETVYVGDSRVGNLKLFNSGNEDLVVGNVVSNVSAIVPLQTTITVPPEQEGVIAVRYNPAVDAVHNGTLTITSNDFLNPTHTASVTGTAVPSLDLFISRLEVTQAIQTPDNTLPLIWGKKTAVRTFVGSTIKGAPNESNKISNVDGLMHIYKDGIEISDSPLKSANGPIRVQPIPDRNQAKETLNFVIPPELMKKLVNRNEDVEIAIGVEINPVSGSRVPRLKEGNYGNNRSDKSLYFAGNYIPTVYYIPVTQTNAFGRAIYPLPSSQKMIQGASLFKKIFPIPGLNYVQRPPLAFKKEINSKNAYDLFAALFFASHLGNVSPPDRTYGWLPEALKIGFAEDIPGRVAAGGRLSDTTAVGGPLVFAHEIGHTYGLCHTHTLEATEITASGGITHCPVDYSDGHQVEFGTITEVGFDTELGETIIPLSLDQWMLCVGSKPAWNQCLGQGALDFMSYGPDWYPRWIHPQRYQFLHQIFRDRFFEPSNARGCNNLSACEKKEPALLVAGFIPEEGDAAIHPIYRAESIPDPVPAAIPSPYIIQALDQNGDPLFVYPLNQGGSAGLQQTDHDLFTFSLIIPDVEGLETIQLLKEGEIVAKRSKTNHAPAMTLISPKGGEAFDEILEVRWNASDEDGDALVYSILYSADGGKTFESIAIDLLETSFQYDVHKLPGSSSAIVRVVATDGFNTTLVDSAPSQVSPKPPQIFISSPLDGKTEFVGTRISLEAEAFDLEDSTIPPDRIEWRSDAAGDLGRGNPLSVTLPLGVHNLSATATDHDGNSTTSHVRILVVDGAEAPRAHAGQDQAVEEGERVVLDASQTTDPVEGDTLAYEWTQTEGPSVVLDDATASDPVFTAPQVSTDTSLLFLLTVTDSNGNTATDTVDIVVRNTRYPSLVLSREEINFGTVQAGGFSAQSFAISNDGNETLEVTGFELSRGVFKTGLTQVTLEPGASQEITVTFAPAEEASYEGTLRVQSNSVAGIPSTVVLKGTTPDPKIFYNDNGIGGSLLPEEFSETSKPENPQPGSSPQEEQSGKTPDPGSFGFVGTGGCSLVAR